MSLAFLSHYLLLNMFRMLIYPSSGACDLFVELFHGMYCSVSMCVGVTVWFGWGGVVSGCRLKHCIWIPHHLGHKIMQYNYSKKIFTGIEKPIRLAIQITSFRIIGILLD